MWIVTQFAFEQGFCPVQEYEQDEQKGATDFKSSEEETGLGELNKFLLVLITSLESFR